MKNFFYFTFFILVFSFFLWTASNGKKSYLLNESDLGATVYHVQMANAFLAGQVSLLEEPKKELLELADPYDPHLNEKLRIHDASLYKEKYYFYFSPVPTILLTIPFKILTGGKNLTDGLSAVIFGCIGFLFSCLIFRKILIIFNIKTNIFFEMTCFLLLAFITNVPFILRRSDVYEVCSLAAYAFMMISIYLFLKIIFSKNPLKNNFLISILFGTTLGLTVASRPNQVIAVFSLLVGFLYFSHRCNRQIFGTIIMKFIFISIPMIFIFAMMAWYNHIRFDSIYEFGFSYQLRGEDMSGVPLYSLKRMPLNIFVYLFHPYQLDFNFPFFHPTTPIKPSFDLAKTWFTYVTVGWFSYPITWFLLLPLFLPKDKKLNELISLKLAKFFLLVSLFSIGSVALVHGECLRYMLDFSPLLMLAFLLLFSVCKKNLFNESGGGIVAAQYIFYLLAGLSCLISLLISITGPYEEGVLKLANPILFDKFYYFFR